jgi:hypothetical protein
LRSYSNHRQNKHPTQPQAQWLLRLYVHEQATNRFAVGGRRWTLFVDSIFALLDLFFDFPHRSTISAGHDDTGAEGGSMKMASKGEERPREGNQRLVCPGKYSRLRYQSAAEEGRQGPEAAGQEGTLKNFAIQVPF